MKLPIFNDDNTSLMLLQNKWSAIINPLLGRLSNQSVILQGVVLANGTTVVNHLLGRKLQGWKIIRQRALASVYDSQDSNQSPQLTLILVSSALVSVDLEVF